MSVIGKNYKPQDWNHCRLICKIDSYYWNNSVGLDNSKNLSFSHYIVLECTARFPPELEGSSVEVTVWDDDELQVQTDIDVDYPAVGHLHVQEQDAPNAPAVLASNQTPYAGDFIVSQPVTPEYVSNVVEMLTRSELVKGSLCEVEIDVVGILSEWNMNGKLSVTNFKILFARIATEE